MFGNKTHLQLGEDDDKLFISMSGKFSENDNPITKPIVLRAEETVPNMFGKS